MEHTSSKMEMHYGLQGAGGRFRYA